MASKGPGGLRRWALPGPLRGLLLRGHEVDFFTELSEPLLEHPAFRVVPLLPRLATRMGGLHPGGPLLHGMDVVTTSTTMRRLAKLVEAEHGHRRYDAFAFMGMMSQWRLTGIPVLVWEQEAPGGEVDALKSVRELIIELGGRYRYSMMRAYQSASTFIRTRGHVTPDALLCGSNWAKERFVRAGYKPDTIWTVPYPVDTTLFAPASSEPASEPPMFVHLGRCDPRKRLDLLVAAFRSCPFTTTQSTVADARGARLLPCESCSCSTGRVAWSYTPWLPHQEMPGFWVALMSSCRPAKTRTSARPCLKGFAQAYPWWWARATVQPITSITTPRCSRIMNPPPSLVP